MIRSWQEIYTMANIDEDDRMEIQRSLAFLYQQSGILDEELEKSRNSDKGVSELDLLLAKGDRSAIRDYAEQVNLTHVIANLDLLAGDPSLMVDILTTDIPLIAKPGVDLIKVQYAGGNDEELKSKLVAQLKTQELFGKGIQTVVINQVMKSYGLTGSKDLIEEYLIKNYPMNAFSYIASNEEPVRALKVLGIIDDESLNQYIKRETEIILKKYTDLKEKNKLNEISVQDVNPFNLFMLVDFYAGRNQRDKAKQIIEPLLDELKNLDVREFQDSN